MKIRFKEDTNIRQTPDTSRSPLGVAYTGTEITVELAPSAHGTNQWFRDENGWYYWAGGTEIVPEFLPPPVEPPPPIRPLPPINLPPPLAPLDHDPLPPVTAFPMVLLGDEEAVSADIPPGETRRLTIARTNLPDRMLEVFKDLAPVERAETVQPLAAILESMPPVVTVPVFPSNTPAILEKSNLLTRIDPQKLSWGVEQYGIETDWWKNRQLTGRGVSIALLSTGVLPDHPDLRSAIQEQASFIGGSAQDAIDVDGLGTQAAVVAAGRGELVYGVAPEATLLVGMVGQYDRDITAANLLAGLRWAMAAKADIIALLVDLRDWNEDERPSWNRAVQEALDQHIILLAPVGNSLERRPEARYPANLEGVLSIGAHDQSALRSPFSAKSYRLDVLAPGEGLLTSDLRGQPAANLKTTSIATAYMAGFLALVKQWEKAHNHILTPAAISALLRNTAVPHKAITQGDDVEYGYGVLNPAAILQQLETTYASGR